MQKFILLSIIAMGMCIGLGSLSPLLHSNSASAQNTNTTDFTTFFKDNKDFRHCFEIDPSRCVDTIDVLYQDNSTIALKSNYIDVIWKAVSIVKKDGYKLDGFSTYAADSDINTLVVMSK
jgi:hypothetical protein